MPMLPDEVKVKVAALRKERESWLSQALDSSEEYEGYEESEQYEYCMNKAEQCEAQLDEYEEHLRCSPSRAPTVQLWSTSGAALWKLGASSRAPTVQPS